MPHRLRKVSGLLWVLPALLLVCVFVYYPVVDNLRLSFYKYSAFSESRYVGLDNYIQAWNDPVFWTSLRNNVAYAVVSIVVQVGGGLALAALLEDVAGPRIRGLLRTVYFIPAVVSITVAGVLFTFLYHPEIGLIDQALRAIGLDSWARNWLGEESTAIWSIIGMSQWQSIGYVTMLYTIAIQRVPRELYEAAHIDGASKVRTFFAITVPLVREMTALLTIVTVSGAFLVFNEVVAMTDGGPNNSSHVLGTWLYKSAFFNDDMGYASAIATVIFVLTVAVAVVQLAQTRRKQVAF
jgi:raffinose/stachyose/melibiose transport system permease protein